MSINPVQFAHSVCDEFLRYLFSAFPLSDPDLRDQFRRLLDRPSSLDTPLVQGPFVSLSEAFAKGDPVQQLADKGTLHHAMPGLIGYPSMYLHQQKVLEAVKDGRHVLVSTGTGSGKTESFLYPIIDDLLRQRDQGVREGVTAVLVYPMNALANDQLDRLRDVLGGTGVTFGQWVGTTPATEGDVGVERFQGSSRPAYLDARRKRREEAQAEDRAVRPLAPPEECCSEDDIRERKPRILLTNYRQLEVLSTRLPDVSLFAEAPLKYLVFDEAHTYAGATGAEVACLIRRLRALAGKKPDEVVCVGTSATLADPTGTDQAARRFASRFFGVDPERVTLVGESYVSREWPKGRYKPVAPHGDGMDRLGRVLHAVTDPADVQAVKAVVEELTGQLFDSGDDWAEALFDHLVTNEYVFQATNVLKRPGKLDEAAWHTSQRLRPGRLPQGGAATAELLAYLVLGASARKNGDSLLRPKVHFFVRGLDEMVAALAGTADATALDVALSLTDAKDRHPGRRDDAFFPVLVCRSCGQHFLERWYQGLELSRGARNQLKGFDHGDAVEDGGKENAVWATAPAEAGTRLVLTHRLLEEADSGPTARSQRWPRGYFCRQCGAMHRDPASRCLADGCGHPGPLRVGHEPLRVDEFPPGLLPLPAVGVDLRPEGPELVLVVRLELVGRPRLDFPELAPRHLRLMTVEHPLHRLEFEVEDGRRGVERAVKVVDHHAGHHPADGRPAPARVPAEHPLLGGVVHLGQPLLDVGPRPDEHPEPVRRRVVAVDPDDGVLRRRRLPGGSQDVVLVERERGAEGLPDLGLDLGRRERLVRLVVLALGGPEGRPAALVDQVDPVLSLAPLAVPLERRAPPEFPEEPEAEEFEVVFVTRLRVAKRHGHSPGR